MEQKKNKEKIYNIILRKLMKSCEGIIAHGYYGINGENLPQMHKIKGGLIKYGKLILPISS